MWRFDSQGDDDFHQLEQINKQERTVYKDRWTYNENTTHNGTDSLGDCQTQIRIFPLFSLYSALHTCLAWIWNGAILIGLLSQQLKIGPDMADGTQQIPLLTTAQMWPIKEKKPEGAMKTVHMEACGWISVPET